MMIQPRSPTQKQFPLSVVGSTKFSRYNDISDEQTFNMIISDNALVNHAGYVVDTPGNVSSEGRAVYASVKTNTLYFVSDDNLYARTTGGEVTLIASLQTSTGDVFISENNSGQLAICDKRNIYIYDYLADNFYIAGGATISGTSATAVPLDFLPGYIDFQNTYFLSVDLNSATWRLGLLSTFDGDTNGLIVFPDAANYVGEFESKADNPVAAIRVPSKGNLLFVMGSNVTQIWTLTGQQLFPYDLSTYVNIDYGCVNSSTIARNDELVVWLARNENSGPVIMVSTGDLPQPISTDGINFKLAQLQHPTQCYGFLYKQDGHLLYQITFFGDNLTYVYDFNTKLFFSLSDEYMNYHIAKRVSFFNNDYFFVSINDGNLYLMGSQYTTYNGNEIPFIRVCAPLRTEDSSLFVVDNVAIVLEQGDSNSIQRIDLSVSKDGSNAFSSYIGYQLNRQAFRANKCNFWNLGLANNFVVQLRFWGMSRCVYLGGMVTVHQ